MQNETAHSIPNWNYEEMSLLSNARPILQEVFSVKDPVKSFLNELFQNVKDAKSPVLRLRWISLSVSSLAFVNWAEIVERLAGMGHPVKIEGDKFACLVIEDEGTGMGGEFRFASRVGELPGGYQAFACGQGNSSKGRGNSGSKGVGRFAIMSASLARVMLAVTNRAEDGKTLFFGLSTLDLHTYKGVGYRAEGQFLGTDEEGKPLPVLDDAAYDLADKLGMGREKGKNGTTLMVPALREEFSKSEILGIILKEHFTAIATGRLTVELIDEQGTVSIDADTIAALAEQVHGAAHAEMIKSVRKLFSDMQETDVDLGELRTRFEAASIGEANLDRLTESFKGGEAVSLSVSFTARKLREDKGERGTIRIGAVRNDALTDGVLILMRDGINKVIPLKGRPYVVIVISAGDAVAEMLRAGEDASHMHWSASTMIERGWAHQPARTVCPSFENGGYAFLDALTKRFKERDDTVYADIFAMPRQNKPVTPDSTAKGGDEAAAKKEENEEGEDRKPQNPTPVLSEKVQPDASGNWGFEVKFSDRGLRRMESGTPYKEFQFGAVYAVSEGKRSVKKHSAADFDLTKCSFEAKGCTVSQIDVMTFVVTDLTAEFSVKVIGDFDPSREIEVLLMTQKDGKKTNKQRKAA